MPRKNREIVTGLKAKGFEEAKNRKHIHFVYVDKTGRTTTSRTMVSHDAGGSDIHDGMLKRMATQVGLGTKEFLDLIDCPMSRDDFDAKIAPDENV
jgi:predicted RNA binding protein YcfA (HicA-like mRNA interferase family)